MSVTINGSTGVTTPGISNSEGYTGDGLTIAAGAPSGAVALDASGNLGVGTTSPSSKLTIAGGTAGTYADGILLSKSGGNLYGVYTDANDLIVRSVTGSTEVCRFTYGGNLLVGTTSGGERLSVAATQDCASFKNTGGTGKVYFLNSSASTIGSITWTGSTTTYSTSSDYRLKNSIAPMTGALAKVAALKPCTYKWNADGSDGEGFIAHELAEVCPQAVTGEKDAVDAEGKPVYQGIDTSFLVATLTAAIQELKAELDTVKAELAAMKGTA